MRAQAIDVEVQASDDDPGQAKDARQQQGGKRDREEHTPAHGLVAGLRLDDVVNDVHLRWRRWVSTSMLLCDDRKARRRCSAQCANNGISR